MRATVNIVVSKGTLGADIGFHSATGPATVLVSDPCPAGLLIPLKIKKICMALYKKSRNYRSREHIPKDPSM